MVLFCYGYHLGKQQMMVVVTFRQTAAVLYLPYSSVAMRRVGCAKRVLKARFITQEIYEPVRLTLVPMADSPLKPDAELQTPAIP
jgi:hypothetical protein